MFYNKLNELVPKELTPEPVGQALDLGVSEFYAEQGLGLFHKLVKGDPKDRGLARGERLLPVRGDQDNDPGVVL